ncbi:hypothetical protein NDU88_008615 [Pleurodeles waltl]|uniref:Uncharacterized protein n=1 Tax=Pleurodeles waltl TaxID=8319 RepID=A0AAV7QV41_PLEWA|nr:hypothetical protein NDU88_008615 [Pleurodeles waltl]
MLDDALDVNFVAVVSDFMSDGFKMIDEKKWEDSDREDSVLQMVKENVKKGWPGKGKVLEELAPFCSVKDELETENSFVFKKGNRVPEIPATYNDDPRTDECPGGPAESDNEEVGNLDIRVSEILKSDEGQRARRAVTEKNEEETDAERHGENAKEEDRRTNHPDVKERNPGNRGLPTSRDDPTEGQGGPRRQQLRHVPGGAWLHQGASAGRGWKRAEEPRTIPPVPQGDVQERPVTHIKGRADMADGGENAEVKSGKGQRDTEEKANQGREDQDPEDDATKETRPGDKGVAEEEQADAERSRRC